MTRRRFDWIAEATWIVGGLALVGTLLWGL